MRKPDSGDFLSTSLTTLVLVANLSVCTAWAQRPFANGDAGERGATRVLFWSLEGKQALGQMAMGYGRPEWTDQLAASFDEATRGRVWRCGRNFWTTLDSGFRFNVGKSTVEAGYYYIAVRRSEDGGEWELLLIDSTAARQLHLDAFETTTARAADLPVQHALPLRYRRSDTVRRTLEILLESRHPDAPLTVALTIRWGNHELTSDLDIDPPVGLAARTMKVERRP